MAEILFRGRSCRLPGGRDVKAFSRLLNDGKCAVSWIPPDRWGSARYLHPTPGTSGKAYTFAAGVLDDLFGFDPQPFGISPREAGQMDPQQRILLEVVWEALEDAGLPPSSVAGTEVGVYVGASALDYSRRLGLDGRVSDAYMMTGNTLSLVSNRISHVFDLRGPSMTIDTACSSSLVAMNEAMKALRSGRIDMAIVAGSNVLLDPVPFIGFSAARMLSPNGLCQPFSANADGYVRAEGAVAFVLHRVDNPEGYPSYASLVDVETNADGRTVNVALPSPDGQRELLDMLYARAEVDPNALAFVEAHGTGTFVGDPVEAEALGRAIGQKRTEPLPIGSVKSNIGHLEPASGVAGVLKALLAFETGTLPASLHAETLNPNIPFGELNLTLAQAPIKLAETGTRAHAGVSSFGFGGTNVHAILAAPQAPVLPQPDAGEGRILVSSAFAREALTELAAAHAANLADPALTGADRAAYLGAARGARDLHPVRVALAADDPEATAAALADFAAGRKNPAYASAETHLSDAPPVFTFSGNGSQFAGMSLAALASDPVFAATYAEVDRLFADLSGVSLLELAKSDDLAQQLSRVEVAQPLLFADQIASAAALEARGLVPAAAIGHSGGEVAAAWCAGALDLEQAVRLTYERAYSQIALHGRGTMAALQVSEAEARAALDELGATGIDIAAVNSPRSISLVGPAEAIADFIPWAKRARRWAAVRLRVEYPYHSAVQDEIEAELRDRLAFLTPKPTRIPFISSVTGREMPGEALGVAYWWSNVRQPVRFLPAIETAQTAGFMAFVEIGPQPALASYIKASLGEAAVDCCIAHSAMKSDTAASDPMRAAWLRALVGGCRVVDATDAVGARRAVRALPKYPFQNTEFRRDQTGDIQRYFSANADFAASLGSQDLTGEPIWTVDLEPRAMPELADHVVGDTAVIPGAVYLDAALGAAQRSLGSDLVELRDFDIVAPLPLVEGAVTEMKTAIDKPARRVTIASRGMSEDAAWRDHVSGRIGKITGARPDIAAPGFQREAGDRDGAMLYAIARQVGLNYGPAFQRVAHLRSPDADHIEVVLTPSPFEDRPELGRFAIDPIALDAVFHGLIARLVGTDHAAERLGFVPVHVGRMRLFAHGARLRAGRVSVRRVGARSILADFHVFDEAGALVAHLEGVRFRAVRLFKPVDLRHHAYVTRLEPATMLPGARDPGLGVDPEDMVADLLTRADTDDAGDETFLLVEAIAQRIAYDTLSGLRGADGSVVLPAEIDSERATYVAALCENLAEMGLAEADDAGWRLAQTCDLPETGELLAALISDRPDLGAEYGLLATLHHRLGDWLRDGGTWDSGELLGRAALDNVRIGSSFAQLRARLLNGALIALVDAADAPRALRVAELSTGPVTALRALDAALPERAMALFRIAPTREGADAGLGPEDLAISRPLTELAASAEDLARHGPFDLVIASGTLRAFDDDPATLGLLETALAPGGAVLMLEDTPSSFREMVWGIGGRWFDRSAGPDFPVGAERGTDDLERLFADNWPGTARIVALPDGYAGAALVVAVPHRAEAGRPVLSEVQEGGFSETLARAGYRAEADPATGIVVHRPAQTSEDNAPVICHVPLAGGVDATGAVQARIEAFRTLLEAWAKATNPVWVFLPRGAANVGGVAEPVQAAIWAFLRTASNEYPALDLRSFDRDDSLDGADVATRLLQLTAAPGVETEAVLGRDAVSALRIWQGLGDTVATDDLPFSTGTRLVSDAAGTLDDLDWRRVSRAAPGPDEVEVEIAATGLNYRDVMWAQGLLPEEALETGFAGATLGIECAGRVARVGANVTDLAPGDPVVTFGPGCFASHMVMHRDWVGQMPEDIDLAAAATIPVAFFTAYYAMVDLGRIGAGDTILIHGGAGGVGLAAIQIAQAAGATVIATAGSAVKQDTLRALGVEHVLSSRSLEFGDQVRAITGGAGVDLVLNSLAGEAMEASLNLLKPFGRFLELGKQDFYANTGIGLRPLKENISYFGIDVDQLLALRPDHARGLFAEMIGKFRDGTYRPLPYRLFGHKDVVEAFRVMQRSAHLGKIVVAPAEPDASLRPLRTPGFAPDPKGWQVIVGGLGGLGLALAEWLVGAGAQRVALTGRSGKPDAATAERIARLIGRGAEVRAIACDVSDAGATAAMFANLRKEAPVKGVIHSAMVLDDMPIKDLTAEGLARTLPAKIAGIDNLDTATRADRLDHFVAFSSIATMIGNHGQAAYVAANAYVEAVMAGRKAQGLPALAVGWGPITDAGYLAREADKARLIRKITGNASFNVGQAIHALERLLARAGVGDDLPATVTISPMGWSGMLAALPLLKGPTYAKLAQLGRTSGEGGDFEDLRGTLMALPVDKAETRLVGFLTTEIARILRVPENALSASRAVSDFGMDSLMGVELGLAAQRVLGDDVPMMAISDELSIRDIARKIVTHLHGGDAVQMSSLGANMAAQHLGENAVARMAEGDTDDADPTPQAAGVAS